MATTIGNAVDRSTGMTLSSSISENLYNETLHTLRSCENKLFETSELLCKDSPSSTSNDVTQYMTFFRNEIESVEKLELRMAIVGPMKAGKSTILNAIMGYDLLPSRNTAMTTLPTEILFSPHIKQPQLILKSELINAINKIGRELKLESKERNLEIRLRNEEDLITLVHNISKNELMTLEAITSENSKILDSLKYINDIVRISIMLNKENSIDSAWIPRLKVPLPHSFSIPKGEFIIIDTPGPNDGNLSAHLRQIVISQLQKATLILVAVDFIGSDSNDETKLQKDIATIREYRDSNSPAHLYALVNKIDQRIENKHNTIESTKAAVAIKYEIPLPNVHEISAMNALVSHMFLHEYKSLENKSNVTHETLGNQMKSYKMFVHQAFGQSWEETAHLFEVNHLPNIAENLWKKSNYDSFLLNTLGLVTQHVVPICLITSLQKCNYYMQKYYDMIRTRKVCLDIDETQLLETVNRLEEDREQLDRIQKNAENNLDAFHNEVAEYIKHLFDSAVNQSAQSVAECLTDNSMRHSRTYWKKLLFGKDILYFETEDEADLFFETFQYSVKDVSEDTMHTLSRNMHEDINRMCFAFRNRLKLLTADTCERIGVRLQLLLGFEVNNLRISSNALNMEHLSKALTQTEIPVRRRLWYCLWLFKGTVKVKMNQLSRKQLEHDAMESLKENFKLLEQHAINEAKEPGNAVFNSHFALIKKHLLEQCGNIRTAINDKRIERQAMEKKFDLSLKELKVKQETIQKLLVKINTYFKE